MVRKDRELYFTQGILLLVIAFIPLLAVFLIFWRTGEFLWDSMNLLEVDPADDPKEYPPFMTFQFTGDINTKNRSIRVSSAGLDGEKGSNWLESEDD